LIKNGQVQLIINTPSNDEARADGRLIRRTALAYKIPIVTTIAGAKATAAAIRALQASSETMAAGLTLDVKALQDYAT
jgi:carbamoyl-phosphate synthase large subunit